MKKLLSVLVALMMLCAVPAMAEKLTMATNATFPPYEYVDEGSAFGGFAGIDVEVADAIAKKLHQRMCLMIGRVAGRIKTIHQPAARAIGAHQQNQRAAALRRAILRQGRKAISRGKTIYRGLIANAFFVPAHGVIIWCQTGGRPHRPDRERCSHAR